MTQYLDRPAISVPPYEHVSSKMSPVDSAEQLAAPREGALEVGGAALHLALQSDTMAPEGSIDTQLPNFERVDTLQEVARLELRSIAKDFIAEWVVEHADASEDGLTGHPIQAADLNNQFVASLVGAMLREERDVAYMEVTSAVPQDKVHEVAIQLISEHFDELHDELHRLLQDRALAAVETAEHRLAYTGDISWNDRYQFKGKERRSLDIIKQDGLTVHLSAPAVAEIARAAHSVQASPLPILEVVKNKRMAEIGGFQDSKFSLLIHDYVDHYWTMDLLTRTGVMDRHASLFDSIGNPEKTDIFKREGEAVASISFGVRYYEAMDDEFRPLVDTAQLADQMRAHAEAGRLRPEHQVALATVTSLTQDDPEYHSLGFAYSNYVTELDEQRRKFGKIKVKDVDSGQITGELDPAGPDYLSFFIDAHHQLAQEENGYQDALIRAHAFVEAALRRIAASTAPDAVPTAADFVILPSEVNACQVDQLGFEPGMLDWMQRNYGFMATKSMALQAAQEG